ncbi:hypothetical protein ApAK_01020 [Thermoplasmatales archaeon AK]|nr:hypothetical protein [Thermoplasmatales archaeon AK]
MDYLNGTNFGLIGMNFDDPAAVAGFLQELSTDSSVLANHSMEAVRIVKHNFSKEEHCNRLLDIYSKLVDSGDQRS